MLQQGFIRCYYDFNPTVSRSGTWKVMFITDTFSPAYLEETLPLEEEKSLKLVDHTENLRVSPSRLTRIEQESSQDPVCTNLQQLILEGCPGNINECDLVSRSFFQFRDALIV